MFNPMPNTETSIQDDSNSKYSAEFYSHHKKCLGLQLQAETQTTVTMYCLTVLDTQKN